MRVPSFFAIDFDPVEKGYVASMSHPGHNTTGIFASQLELAGKRIEILRDAFPMRAVWGFSGMRHHGSRPTRLYQ